MLACRSTQTKGTTMQTHDRFEAVNEDYLKFDRIKNKQSSRPDLNAFLLLDRLFPRPDTGIISAAGHDQIWLAVKEESIAALNDDHILELVRCGVCHDSEYGDLFMFA